VASGRRACSSSAISGSTSSPRSAPPPARTSRPPDVHVALVLDGAGWHLSRDLTIPENITPVVLPSYSPELDPVERVWLYLRERFLSLRLFPSTDAVVDACCAAWMRLVAESGRLKSLCAYPWIEKVAS
jgi:hypothetical protein